MKQIARILTFTSWMEWPKKTLRGAHENAPRAGSDRSQIQKGRRIDSMPSNQIPSFFTSKKMRKVHGFPENDLQRWVQNGISTSSSPVVASLNASWSIISTFYTNHQNEDIQYKSRISEGRFTKLGRKDDTSPTRRRCEMAKSMRWLMMTRWYIKDHKWENNADQKGDGAAILNPFIEWAGQLSAVCLKTKRPIIHFNIT